MFFSFCLLVALISPIPTVHVVVSLVVETSRMSHAA